MAVERIRSFCIREYTAKSRAVDLERCWPLGRVGEKEERRLPPMTWRKFRWWSSELDTARSADLAGKDEEEVEEEVADGLRKVTRTPKKRSIVEIFAVAPQIGGGGKDLREEVEEEEEEGDLDGSNLEVVKRRKEQSIEILMKKKSAEMMKKKNWGKIYDHKMINSTFLNKKQKPTTTTMRTTHQTDKKKKKQIIQESKCGIGDKGKMNKFSFSSHMDVSKSELGRIENEVNNQDVKRKHGAVKSSQKQKKQKKQKTSGTTKSSIRKQDEKSPKDYNHSILKTRERLHHLRQSDKRVSFSGSESILGPLDKNHPPMEFLHLQNLSKGFSDTLAPSSDAYATSSKQPPDADEVRVDVEDGLHIAPASVHDEENPSFPDGTELHDAPRHLAINIIEPINHENCLEMEKMAPFHSVDLNRSLSSSGDLNVLVPCTSPAPFNRTGSGCSVEISKQVPMLHSVEGVSSSKHNGIRRPPKVGSQDSSRNLTMVNEKDDGQSFHLLDSSSNLFNAQPFYNVPRIDVWNNHCSLVPGRPFSAKDTESGGLFIRSDAAAIIQLQSHGNVGTTNLSEARAIGFSSGCSSQNSINAIQTREHQNRDGYLDTRICTKERSFFTDQPLVTHQPNCRHRMAANVFPELPIPDMNIQYQEPGHGFDRHAHRFLLDHRPSSFHEFRGHNEEKRRDETEKASTNDARDVASQPSNQPTIRLMGKNLTVGKSNQEFEGFEDGSVWTDKEIIAEQNTVVRVPDESFLKWHPREKHYLAFGRSESNLPHPMESYMCHHSDSGYYHEGDAHRGIQHSYLDCTSHCIPRSGSLIVQKRLSRLDPFYPPESNMQKQPQNVSGNQSMRMFSQLPMASSVRYDNRCNMPFNSVYDEYKKRPSSSLLSAVSPAIWNMDPGNRIRHEFPAQNLQQCLLDTTKYTKVQNVATYPGPFSDCHSQTIFDVNLHPFSSPYSRSAVSFPSTVQRSFNRPSPELPMTSSFGNSFTRHFPMVMMSSDYQESWIHRDGLSYRIVFLDEHDQAKTVKRRPSAKPDDVMKAAKKPNLVILNDPDIPEGSMKTGSPRGRTVYTSAAPDFCVNGVNEIVPEVNEKFVHPNASKSSSSKLGSGSGPIKLSAGAKHILKPCENMGMDKSRPIHSTILFPTRSEPWKAPVPQKKAPKIYQF